MLDSLLVGQYYPGDSPLHRLDPRTKLLATVLLSVLLFWSESWASLGVGTGFVLVSVLISGVPFSYVWRGLRPMLAFLVAALAVGLLAYPGEHVLWQWQTLKITSEGVAASGHSLMRLLGVLVGATLLTLTTAPMTLTDGLERLLRPLEKLKVPAGDLALMMSIALRFIPTLVEETKRIQRAQASRGARFTGRGVVGKIKSLLPLVVPLFASAIRRAEELAMAMEARAFRSAGGRTRYRIIRFTWRDVVAAVVLLAVAVLVWRLR